MWTSSIYALKLSPALVLSDVYIWSTLYIHSVHFNLWCWITFWIELQLNYMCRLRGCSLTLNLGLSGEEPWLDETARSPPTHCENQGRRPKPANGRHTSAETYDPLTGHAHPWDFNQNVPQPLPSYGPFLHLQPHCHETHHLTQGLGCVCVEERLQHLVITAHYVSHITFAVICNQKHLALWGENSLKSSRKRLKEKLWRPRRASRRHMTGIRNVMCNRCGFFFFTGLHVFACLCTRRTCAVVYDM